MSRGKNKPKFENPAGAPYILFETNDGYEVAVSFDQITKKHKKVQPANVLKLIKQYGHVKANTIIHQYAKSWVCKDGKIYIKEVC